MNPLLDMVLEVLEFPMLGSPHIRGHAQVFFIQSLIGNIQSILHCLSSNLIAAFTEEN
jgi:hypothetical protein